ncbi:hypothetical protein NECAME_06540 [Necator americanus]|uniref:Uncharacterized protein n=1 Tax=Necator americanus TaxID=51031 RepID=W2TVR4_NECAM|nr:hypothetical protein NECAME_06540 [Necator americanus]ETN85151.1 hypothetical protein NECAME_06540 [Necator americanus]
MQIKTVDSPNSSLDFTAAQKGYKMKTFSLPPITMSVTTLSLCAILVLFPLATLQRWEDNAPKCSTDLNLRLQPKQRDGLFKAVSGKYAYMKYNCTLEEAAYLLWNSRYNATPEKFNTIFGLYPFYYNWTETNKTSAEFFKEAADKWRNDTLNDVSVDGTVTDRWDAISKRRAVETYATTQYFVSLVEPLLNTPIKRSNLQG